jgi:membrane-associated HD superfamily phosphohydrolase
LEVVDHPSGRLPDGNLFRLEGGTLLPMFRVFGKRANTLILLNFFFIFLFFYFLFFFVGAIQERYPPIYGGISTLLTLVMLYKLGVQVSSSRSHKSVTKCSYQLCVYLLHMFVTLCLTVRHTGRRCAGCDYLCENVGDVYTPCDHH